MKRLMIRSLTICAIFLVLITACAAPQGADGVQEGSAAAEEAAQEQTDEGEGVNEDAQEEAVDLSGEKVEIILIGDLSGPGAFLTTPTIRGVQDAVKMLNQQGGVSGAELMLSTIDNGGLVEETVAAFQEVAADAALVMVVNRQDAEALLPMAADEEVPVLNLSDSVPLVEPEGENYIFSLAVPFEAQLEYFLDYLAEKWKQVRPAGAEDDIKLAVISWSDEYGQAALTQDTRAYAQGLDIEIVTEATFSPSMTEDLVDELLSAQRAGANVIYTNTWLHGPAVLLNDLHGIALADDFLVGGPVQSLDSVTYGFLRQPEFYNGFYAPFTMAWWSDEGNPAIRFALDAVDENQRGITAQTQGYLLGFAGADLARQVLAQTVKEVGMDRLSGETVYIALSTLEDYHVLDGLMTVDFTGGSRTLNAMQMRQVDGFMDFVVRSE